MYKNNLSIRIQAFAMYNSRSELYKSQLVQIMLAGKTDESSEMKPLMNF